MGGYCLQCLKEQSTVRLSAFVGSCLIIISALLGAVAQLTPPGGYGSICLAGEEATLRGEEEEEEDSEMGVDGGSGNLEEPLARPGGGRPEKVSLSPMKGCQRTISCNSPE